MVDPNRKINRLTDKDIEFLEECEQEFNLRYTDQDSEFSEYINKPLGDPPIVENWTFGGGGDDGRRNDGGGGRNFNNRGGNRPRGNWHDNRGGGGGERGGQYNRNFRSRRGSRGGGMSLGGNDYGNRGGQRNRGNDYKPYERRDNYGQRDNRDHQDVSNRPPITVRRDYGNFVAASKDD